MTDTPARPAAIEAPPTAAAFLSLVGSWLTEYKVPLAKAALLGYRSGADTVYFQPWGLYERVLSGPVDRTDIVQLNTLWWSAARELRAAFGPIEFPIAIARRPARSTPVPPLVTGSPTTIVWTNSAGETTRTTSVWKSAETWDEPPLRPRAAVRERRLIDSPAALEPAVQLPDDELWATTTAEFLALLRRIRECSGASKPEIAEAAQISSSQVYALLHPDRVTLPTNKNDQLRRLLDACRLPARQVRRVMALYIALAANDGVLFADSMPFDAPTKAPAVLSHSEQDELKPMIREMSDKLGEITAGTVNVQYGRRWPRWIAVAWTAITVLASCVFVIGSMSTHPEKTVSWSLLPLIAAAAMFTTLVIAGLVLVRTLRRK